ncbi:hypothetical protein DL96DRAFT_1491083 [Flagelloscypha sp. PMI_526]|nr:hypothetical protein DL96DRAFT_1491083 [Flagelloscypha sp. PMI_526]
MMVFIGPNYYYTRLWSECLMADGLRRGGAAIIPDRTTMSLPSSTADVATSKPTTTLPDTILDASTSQKRKRGASPPGLLPEQRPALGLAGRASIRPAGLHQRGKGSIVGTIDYAAVPATTDTEMGDDTSRNEEIEDEDAQSEFSEGGDFYAALQGVLEGDFNFQGSYYHASSTNSAPDPSLRVEGLGIISLPLSGEGAQALKNASAQAPYGRGSQTIVNKDVRDTWQIASDCVSFGNKKWTKWIKDVVIPSVSASLGVPASTGVVCNLYKLLLYEKGSHFLSHQDTAKEPGMFASVIIVLPSKFSGGQVHLSHSKHKQVIDVSLGSATQTSISAWYTDVFHEVKPVTSGYRLALSYNLVASKSTILPSLSCEMDPNVQSFCHVMRKWQARAYASYGDDEGKYACYILQHQYSAAELQRGIQALKGSDAHLVKSIHPAATDHKIMLCLAQLQYHVLGEAANPYGDDGYGWGSKRYRYDEEDEDEDQDEDQDEDEDEDEQEDGGDGYGGMGEVIEETLSLEEVYDLDGDKISEMMDIRMSDLVPQHPFEDKDPDEEEFGGYTGNEGAPVDQYYHRSVLLIIPEANASTIFFSDGDIEYPLAKLKRASNPPSVRDKTMVDLIVPVLRYHPKVVPTMADNAIKWNDLDLWRRIMEHGFVNLKDGQVLFDGLRAFGFEGVQAAFQHQMDKSTHVQGRLIFAQKAQEQAKISGIQALADWSREQVPNILRTLNGVTYEDIPVLVPLCIDRGIDFIKTMIVPQLKEAANPLPIHLALAKALHAVKPIPASDGESEQLNLQQNAFEEFVEELLALAVPLWKFPGAYAHVEEVDNIMSIIETCLQTGHFMPCQPLFTAVLQSDGTTKDKFTNYFEDIIPRLNAALKKAAVKATTIPFQGFFQILVTLYIRDVLPKKPTTPRHAVPKVPCTCRDCQTVNEFLTSDLKQMTIKLTVKGRQHIQSTVYSVANTTKWGSGRNAGLNITKKPDAKFWTIWNNFKSKGREFIKGIGGLDILREVLGEQGLQSAIVELGLKPAELRGSQPQAAASPPGMAPGRQPPERPSTTASVPTRKKKTATKSKSKGVIDLTLDD